MNTLEQNFQLIINALEVANKNGAFSLSDSAKIFNAALEINAHLLELKKDLEPKEDKKSS